MKRIFSTLANKWPEYLLEIIVITVGVLGAFGLNSWNENRLERLKEQAILKDLHSEFLYNKAEFEKGNLRHDSVLLACRTIISMFPLEADEVNQESFKDYLNGTFNWQTFDPAQGTINSLISSGNFNLIREDSLRKVILSWNDVKNDYLESEKEQVRFVTETYYPYMNKYLPYQFDFVDPRFDPAIFTSIEFENMIYERRNLSGNILMNDGESARIGQTIEIIIALCEKNLNETGDY